ncbi:MAG: single-stranded-DNA-specific exonuclease RecJ [Chthoniobacterales bacterium]|nr:single-stranded-DNA-specific exonuclease RecJ [Chthoniobacterales bacterium]
MNRRWILPPATDPLLTGQLLRELEIPAFLGVLLTQRGHGSIAEAREFLHPKLKSLQPPEALPQMDVAAERVWAAVRAGRRIVLYGDYDVDGITSLALLARVLKAFGGKVECFLPLRVEEGYGLSPAGIERCCELHRPELLLAVDCGTTSVREIASLRSRGVEVIVLDHHEPGSERPDCAALVNPKCGNNFHYLCSAGVVFKLAHAMQKLSPVADLDLRHYLDMVALATVADIVPLTGENRIFVRHGLQRMAATRWVGIAALMRVSGVSAPVRTSDVGFRLGPRINAAGRLGPAQEALRLLLTDDPDEAARLAANLDAHNRERQDVEKAVVRDAEQWVEQNFEAARDTTIVAGRRDWHVGVLGVVASRVMRQRHRPTFIVGFDASGQGKGSGRSIEGLSLVDLLNGCSDHLQKFGGHDMAAGLTMDEKAFPAFREAFETGARKLANAEILTPRLRLDAEIELPDLDFTLLEAQDFLEPFGAGNPQPVLYTRSVSPSGAPRTMKDKHLKFEFPVGRRRVPAVFFNAKASDLPRPPWDLAYTLDWNCWQGRTEAQMRILGVRRSA